MTTRPMFFLVPKVHHPHFIHCASPGCQYRAVSSSSHVAQQKWRQHIATHHPELLAVRFDAHLDQVHGTEPQGAA
jgi:hypothetical protein